MCIRDSCSAKFKCKNQAHWTRLVNCNYQLSPVAMSDAPRLVTTRTTRTVTQFNAVILFSSYIHSRIDIYLIVTNMNWFLIYYDWRACWGLWDYSKDRVILLNSGLGVSSHGGHLVTVIWACILFNLCYRGKYVSTCILEPEGVKELFFRCCCVYLFLSIATFE